MQLSEDQEKALSSLLAWYKDPGRGRFITLGGYAGTGKGWMGTHNYFNWVE